MGLNIQARKQRNHAFILFPEENFVDSARTIRAVNSIYTHSAF